MTLIVCSRMYNVAPGARAAWDELFEWVVRRSGVPLEIVDHAAPAPLEELWARDDMGCVFMCGWPFSQARPQPAIVGAPVPAGDRYGGDAIYFTDLIVRRDGPHRTLADTFGGRVAWTVRDSHSGFNALRRHLLDHRTAERPMLYSESIGPVVTPRAALESVLSGAADVAPLDSYAHDLMRLHAPELVRDVRVIDSTRPAPIPPLVASAGVADDLRVAMREALLSADRDRDVADTLRRLSIAAFRAPDPRDYQKARRWALEAVRAGYSEPR